MRTKLLILTLIFGFLIRFIGLGSNPPSLNWDEIAIGWNAYSLLETGKDEYGQTSPSTFRSFDDYKSPLYIYATAASIALFGKTEFAIRFPSALLGSLSCILIYFLTQRILYKPEITDDKWKNRSANIALFATFFFTFSPWHVLFSRVAFEANTALFFELLGALLFLIWLQNNTEAVLKKITILSLSALSFLAAIYSYGNARLFVPLLLAGWTIINYKKIVKNSKQLIIPLLLGVIVCIPLLMQMYQGVGFARYKATSILYRPEVFERNDLVAKEDYDLGEGWLSSKVHNWRIPYFRQVFDNYFEHFRFSFLFITSDLPRHQIPGFGLLYLIEFPLILMGALLLIKKREQLNSTMVMWWLFAAPVPAALTWQVPHSIRAQTMLPMLSILSGAGLWYLLKKIQQLDLTLYKSGEIYIKGKNWFKWIYPKLLFLSILAATTTSIAIMVIHLHTHLPVEHSKYWLYGRKEMVEYVEKNKQKYDTIVVSLSIDWAYLWFLWYGNYSPQSYLSEGGTVSGGFQETQNEVGKIKFHNFDYTTLKTQPNTLMIGTPGKDFPKELIPEYKINDLSGKPIIYIVKT